MDITFEKVEKLMEKANVSYEEAKDALMRADGDLLDAVILLEKEGKISMGPGGSYSTKEETTSSSSNAGPNFTTPNSEANSNTNYNTNTNTNYSNYKYKDETTDFGEFLKTVGVWLAHLFKASIYNHFDVHRYGVRIVHLPVLGLVILLIACFWVTLPLLVVGLFFSCRYSFSGPDLGKDKVNEAMNTATDAAETIRESVKKSMEESKNENERKDPNN